MSEVIGIPERVGPFLGRKQGREGIGEVRENIDNSVRSANKKVDNHKRVHKRHVSKGHITTLNIERDVRVNTVDLNFIEASRSPQFENKLLGLTVIRTRNNFSYIYVQENFGYFNLKSIY